MDYLKLLGKDIQSQWQPHIAPLQN